MAWRGMIAGQLRIIHTASWQALFTTEEVRLKEY